MEKWWEPASKSVSPAYLFPYEVIWKVGSGCRGISVGVGLGERKSAE